MKKIILASLFTGYFSIFPFLNGQHMNGMMDMMHMENQPILERDILDQLDEKDKQIYQQLTSEQKSMILKIANQFSKSSCEQMMKMHKQMMQDGMMNQRS